MALCHELPFSPPRPAPAARMLIQRPMPRAMPLAEAALLERIDRELMRLLGRGRHAVAIVDAASGDGRLIGHVVRRARALGFTAIDATGFDSDAARVAVARSIARNLRDPAIGLTFAWKAEDAPIPLDDAALDLVIAGPGDALPPLARLTGIDGAVIAR